MDHYSETLSHPGHSVGWQRLLPDLRPAGRRNGPPEHLAHSAHPKGGLTWTTRALSSFSLPEQRLILALVRLDESPASPAAAAMLRRLAPKMMPGHEPYTPAELTTLNGLVADAAAGDPGELAEE